ncbi:D,D-dipeptide ABC transport system permease protein DppC [Thermacetogenium phaeum DSM 12270]|uniref:D,D-dipeptide ABC transport system permease protein DppC n=1 Tax=Thermacetogenium phaeum (strain ATCC BAA-254 / DSM 26808 / PB) TaxID=1089553 RepID=K4LIM5_THEPS|nr:ABC transporter permease [Thermacetogenium phaeum]AFV11912.1 D,D-dipeptide ABC transport system permease protein DppC [Thermacetogenium phaeum DSM 12270]
MIAQKASDNSAVNRYLENFKKAWYKFSRNKMSVVGLVIVVLIILSAVFAHFVAPYPHHAGAFVNYAEANLAPSWDHLLGTDVFGRDILSRIIYAFRGALTMGIGVLVVVVPIGTIIGLIAGYMKGTLIETVLMRITDVFLALPPLILALAVCAVMRPTLFNSMMAVCISWWPWYARLVYGMATSLRNEVYVRAAELIGASRFHIIFREILPNCLAPIFTKMMLDMGWVILTGASLSFVGLGEQPPTPALGTMVSDGAKYLPDYWWISIFPAIAIMIIVLAFNLLGDGVKDMLSTEE